MQIHILRHNKFGEIHIVIINGKLYLWGKDAANSLGFKDTNQAIRNHVQAKDKITTADFTKMAQGDSQNRSDILAGQTQNCSVTFTGQDAAKIPHNAIWINESGLYSLVLHSILPAAKEFQHWVTSEVLPSIRENGYYINPHAPSAPKIAPAPVPENEITRLDKIKILRELLDYTDCKNLRNKLIFDIAYLVTNTIH